MRMVQKAPPLNAWSTGRPTARGHLSGVSLNPIHTSLRPSEVSLSQAPSTTVPVPLAHPQTITTTNNYSEPCVAVAFATSQPGETLTDFRQRLSERDYYTRTRGLELVLDREAATELVRLLIPVVGQTEIGRMVDSQ